jgi:DNA invertase Pin-like site-specific DNA recombinase
MKAAVYLRVSSNEQSTDNQFPALEAYAKNRSYEIVRVYEEEESAWKSGHQRELVNLMSDARQRRFQVVLVWALDRLSREGALAILSLVHKL